MSMSDLYPFKDESPLVSIVIVSRNGLSHLKRLFNNFEVTIQYPNYEIIVVDNASTDGSISFLEQLSSYLPLKIVKNVENKSFSKANNDAVNISKGEYILLLNNDIKPTYGWLNEMMQVVLRSEKVGAVGSKLVYPNNFNSVFNQQNSFKIQHAGIGFKENSDGHIEPYNIAKGLEPFDSGTNLEQNIAGVTAAALLVSKKIYLEVGGLDEAYFYGYEDVDFCLKLLKKGYNNIYCPRSLLFHYEFGTRELSDYDYLKDQSKRNTNIFVNKWGVWLHKQLLNDKLNNKSLFSEKPLKISFITTKNEDVEIGGDYSKVIKLAKSLKKFGWNVSCLQKNAQIGDDVDIIISLIPDFDPNKIKGAKKRLIKIAWIYNSVDKWTINPGFHDYDTIFVTTNTFYNHVKKEANIESILLPITTNLEMFKKYLNLTFSKL